MSNIRATDMYMIVNRSRKIWSAGIPNLTNLWRLSVSCGAPGFLLWGSCALCFFGLWSADWRRGVALRSTFLAFRNAALRIFGVVNFIQLLTVNFPIRVESSSRFRSDSERSAVRSDEQEMDQKEKYVLQYRARSCPDPLCRHRMNYLGLPQVLSSTREHRHVYAATDLERFKQAENNIRVGGAQGLKKGRKP